jgi:Flagellar hook-length control protein FliK
MDLMMSIPATGQTPAGVAAAGTEGPGVAVAADLIVAAATASAPTDPAKAVVPFSELLAMMALGLQGQALQETPSKPPDTAGERLTETPAGTDPEAQAAILTETVPVVPNPGIVVTTAATRAVTLPAVNESTSVAVQTPVPVPVGSSHMTTTPVPTQPHDPSQPNTPVAASAISSQSPPDVANGGIADALSQSEVTNGESAAPQPHPDTAGREIPTGGSPNTGSGVSLDDGQGPAEGQTEAIERNRSPIGHGDDDERSPLPSQSDDEDNRVREGDHQARLRRGNDDETNRTDRLLNRQTGRSNASIGTDGDRRLPDLEIAELDSESRAQLDTAVKLAAAAPAGGEHQTADDAEGDQRTPLGRVGGADPGTARLAPTPSGAVAALVPAGPTPGEAQPTIVARPEALPQTIRGELEDMVQAPSFRRIVIRLDPPDLGEVVLELRQTKDDVSVVIRAETADAARALSRQEGDVQRAVQSLGLELGRFDVGAENGNDARHRPGRPNRTSNPETFATEIADDNPEATHEGVLLL